MTKFKTKIYILFMLLIVTMSLVGTASWMIVLSKTRGIGSAKDYSNPCFTSEGVYTGEVQTPTLNQLGIEVYGSDFISSQDCTIEYVRGVDANGTAFPDFSGHDGLTVGTHYYKITDNKTGQVICDEHAYRITPSPLIVKKLALQSDSKTEFFVGNTIELLLTVNVPRGADNFDVTVAATYTFGESDYFASEVMAKTPTIKVSVSDDSLLGFASNTNIDITLPIECNISKTAAVLLPTTYIVTGANTTPVYYGTINSALDAANTQNAAGTKIMAMQSFNYGDNTYSAATLTATNNYSHVITRNATINSNVSLVLPFDIYGETTNRHLVRADDGTAPANYLPTYAPRCVNLVTFASGNITLNVQGTLLIGGLTGAQSGTPQAITSNSYAALQMRSGSRINIAGGGVIDCLGYITDPDYNATTGVGAQISAASGATIKMPFVVYDYHGGSHTVGSYHRKDGDLSDAISPFNVFDLPNVQAKITCTSGAVISGYGDLYASDVHNYTEIQMLGGAGANAFLILENGSATFKYTPTQGADFGKNASATDYNNSKPSYDAFTKIELNGKAKTGSLSMHVEVTVKLSDYLSGTLLSMAERIFGEKATIAKTVNLSDIRIPISHKFQVSLNGNNSYEITSAYKFLPGASVTVNSGATLKINSGASAIFYSNNIYTAPALTNAAKIAAAEAWLWQKDATGRKEPYRPAAALIVKGTLDVDGGIAGMIVAGGVGAVLDLTGATALSLSSIEGNGGYSIDVDLSTLGALGGDFSKAVEGSVTKVYVENGVAHGVVGLGGSTANLQKKLYTASNIGDGTCGWTQYSITYHWVYNGTKYSLELFAPNIVNPNANYYSEALNFAFATPTITGDGPYFEGWYSDAACTTPISGTTSMTGNLNVYGKWSDGKTYTVSYVTNINNGNVNATIPSHTATDGGTINPYTHGVAASAVDVRHDFTKNRYFIGWYTSYDPATGTFSGEVSSSAGLQITGDTVLYAKWGEKCKITLNSITNVTKIEATDSDGTKLTVSVSSEFYLMSGTNLKISASYTVERSGLTGRPTANISIAASGYTTASGSARVGVFASSATASATTNWTVAGNISVTVTGTKT